MAATITKLTAIAINDRDEPAEYLLLAGEQAWGWVGRVDIDGEFAGFQVVRWDTMTTTRLSVWRRVAHLIAHPQAAALHRWQPTTDEYAADILAADVAQAERAAEEAAVEQQRNATVRADRNQRVAALSAARAGQQAIYAGTLAAHHGTAGTLDLCDCCDDRVVLDAGPVRLEHVRPESVTLAA